MSGRLVQIPVDHSIKVIQLLCHVARKKSYIARTVVVLKAVTRTLWLVTRTATVENYEFAHNADILQQRLQVCGKRCCVLAQALHEYPTSRSRAREYCVLRWAKPFCSLIQIVLWN